MKDRYMLKAQYAEMMVEDQSEARERERIAFDRSIELMETAEAGRSPTETASAIVFTSRLWTVLVEDLASPENGLPPKLRAEIISIGVWVLRELEEIRSGGGKGFSDVLSVSRTIQGGLQ